MLVRKAETHQDIVTVQSLWTEYWESLGLSATFQGFSEECASLPGLYAPPRGALLLATNGDLAGGTAAFRPLDEQACEAKRLYVRPAFRGTGLGSRLLHTLISSARELGYKTIYADTLPSMGTALRWYERVGFRETKPYSSQPTPGAIYLRLFLE